MTMKWFGVSWNSHLNADTPHVAPPIGELCSYCGEAIFANDSGVIYANGPAAHRNCFVRSTAGSVAHIQKRCSCYVLGSKENDPPGMTKRQAADAAAALLGFRSSDAEEEMICDFCSAREPLVRDVKALQPIAGHLPGGTPLQDSGIWGACADCAELIDAKDWQGLVERGVVGVLAIAHHPRTPAREREMRADIQSLLEQVFGVKL